MRRCSKCLWTDICPETKVCPHYTPADDEEFSSEEVELAMAEYQKAWEVYSDMDYIDPGFLD